MTDTAAALNRRHGIAGVVEVMDGLGGLPKVRVTTPVATGEIYGHGAHITSWTPVGHADVLFVSSASRWESGRAIRGGIPVCFPWFANKSGDAQAPAHGLVRTKSWTLESIAQTDAGVAVSLSIESDADTRSLWPFEFRLELRATFGATLHVELAAANSGRVPLTFEEALHTYYAIGDAATVRITGLDGVRYRDKVDDGRERLQEGDVTIAGETDRVYLDTAPAVVIHDPALPRRLHLSTTGARSTVVWNPWFERARSFTDLHPDDWRRMVCVETANVSPFAIALEPGERHAISLTVSATRR